MTIENAKPTQRVNTSSPFLREAPQPPTGLGVYRLLGPRAAVLVSPLQLGGMNFGDAWAAIAGSTTKHDIFKLLDAYVEAGGNWLDTASVYQNEQSEKWIGEWMKLRGNRDRMVISTKYSAPYTKYRDEPGARISYLGNGKRSMNLSLRDSLEKLQTEWIDILYLHWWDYTTSIEEVMDSLHILVELGKVMYLGISNTPAWVVASANTYARDHGKTPFSVYQGQWNVLTRDLEREVLPMCRQFGMAVVPYDAVGGGKLRSKRQLESGDRQATGKEMSEIETKMSETLEKIAQAHDIDSVAAVALAWLLHKQPYVFPIIGTRNIHHMLDNTKALDIRLTAEEMEEIESVAPYVPGYPENAYGEDPAVNGKAAIMTKSAAQTAWVQSARAIGRTW